MIVYLWTANGRLSGAGGGIQPFIESAQARHGARYG